MIPLSYYISIVTPVDMVEIIYIYIHTVCPQISVCTKIIQYTYNIHTIYIHIHAYTCIHRCIHTCIHTCIHAYIHAYMHTYMHTYNSIIYTRSSPIQPFFRYLPMVHFRGHRLHPVEPHPPRAHHEPWTCPDPGDLHPFDGIWKFLLEILPSRSL